jgi:hypothetical protein
MVSPMTVSSAGFLHMALARDFRCPELAGPAAGFETVSARDSTVIPEGRRYER